MRWRWPNPTRRGNALPPPPSSLQHTRLLPALLCGGGCGAEVRGPTDDGCWVLGCSCDKMQFVQKFMARKKQDTGAFPLCSAVSAGVSLASTRSAPRGGVADGSVLGVRAEIFTPDMIKKCQEIIKTL